jgi:hypothetical protein
MFGVSYLEVSRKEYFPHLRRNKSVKPKLLGKIQNTAFEIFELFSEINERFDVTF